MSAPRRPLRWRSGFTTLLVVLPFVGPVFCCCSGMGAAAFEESRSSAVGAVTVAALADPGQVASDAFVEVDSTLWIVGAEPAGFDADQPLSSFDTAYFVVTDQPSVLVRCPRDCERLREARIHHIEARVCDEGSAFVFGCHLDPRASSFADDYAAAEGLDRPSVRVLDMEELAFANLFGACCSFCGAGFFFVLLAFSFVTVIRSGRDGAPRVVETRTWQLPISAAEVEQRLASVSGLTVLERSVNEIVLSQGFGEAKARLLGLWTAASLPRRVTVRWTDEGPYQSTSVEACAEEDLVWMTKLPDRTKTSYAESFAISFAELERSLGVIEP